MVLGENFLEDRNVNAVMLSVRYLRVESARKWCKASSLTDLIGVDVFRKAVQRTLEQKRGCDELALSFCPGPLALGSQLTVLPAPP